MIEEQTKQNVSLEETFEQIETIIVSGRRGKVKDM